MSNLEHLEHFNLPNGIEVFYHQMPEALASSFELSFAAGSYFDPDDKLGLAHFSEHMLFNGTNEIIGAPAVTQAFERLGTYTDASTAMGRMRFNGTVLNEDLQKCIGLWAHVLSDSTFKESEIVNEKGVVIQELQEYQTEPDHVFHTRGQLPATYGTHKLARDTGGEIEHVASISRKDVAEFIHTRITRNNGTLFFVGPHNKEQVIELFSAFDVLPEGKKLPVDPMKTYPTGINAYVPWESEIQKYSLLIPLKTNDFSIIEKLCISRAVSSQLMNKLREQGLIYGANAQITQEGVLSAFCISLETSPTKLSKCIEITSDILNDLQSCVNSDDLTGILRAVKIRTGEQLGSSGARCAYLKSQKRETWTESVMPIAHYIQDDIYNPPMDCIPRLLNAIFGQPVCVASMGANKNFSTAQQVEKIFWGREISTPVMRTALAFGHGGP